MVAQLVLVCCTLVIIYIDIFSLKRRRLGAGCFYVGVISPGMTMAKEQVVCPCSPADNAGSCRQDWHLPTAGCRLLSVLLSTLLSTRPLVPDLTLQVKWLLSSTDILRKCLAGCSKYQLDPAGNCTSAHLVSVGLLCPSDLKWLSTRQS